MCKVFASSYKLASNVNASTCKLASVILVSDVQVASGTLHLSGAVVTEKGGQMTNNCEFYVLLLIF